MTVTECSRCCRVYANPPCSLLMPAAQSDGLGRHLCQTMRFTHPPVAFCLAGDSICSRVGGHLPVVFLCTGRTGEGLQWYNWSAFNSMTQPASKCRSACSSGRSSIRQKPGSATWQQHCSDAVQTWRSAASGRNSSRVGLFGKCSGWRLSSLQCQGQQAAIVQLQELVGLMLIGMRPCMFAGDPTYTCWMSCLAGLQQLPSNICIAP